MSQTFLIRERTSMILKDTPIQRKLMSIILLTCSVALVLMGSAYIIFEYINFREAEKKQISTLGVIIASNSSAALAFYSPDDAKEILNALRADKYIVAACLYDTNGNIFAKYPAGIVAGELPAKPGMSGYFFRGMFLEGFQPVAQENLLLGTLYIKSSLGRIYSQS